MFPKKSLPNIYNLSSHIKKQIRQSITQEVKKIKLTHFKLKILDLKSKENKKVIPTIKNIKTIEYIGKAFCKNTVSITKDNIGINCKKTIMFSVFSTFSALK